jgi:hypothetical protein
MQRRRERFPCSTDLRHILVRKDADMPEKMQDLGGFFLMRLSILPDTGGEVKNDAHSELECLRFQA